ncbi:hypothetical protein GCM10010191_90410 [Actinomadura vinacea]|uniref:Helix-hairpin-helix domain-containing protein n=1 Tax=Actinomadura vinacea TaxID=115336 RepID=A0ABN3KDV8_9ACTN
MDHNVDGPPDKERDQGEPRHRPPSQPPGHAPGPGAGPGPGPGPGPGAGHPTGPFRRPPHPHPGSIPGRPPMTPGWRPGLPVPPVPPMPPSLPSQLPITPGVPRGILWSLVPLLTFGYGTPFSFMFAALRNRSAGLGATAAGYGVVLSAAMVAMVSGGIGLPVMGMIMMLVLWLGGTAHAFAVRPSVFPRASPHSRRNEHAVKLAQYRRTLRDEARALVTEDPALAHELRIGRPDLPRGYDDGGLIDVNHAPAATLALLPGLTEELIERIVRHRDEQGGFISAEELAVDVDLPPSLLPQLSEYAIFLP